MLPPVFVGNNSNCSKAAASARTFGCRGAVACAGRDGGLEWVVVRPSVICRLARVVHRGLLRLALNEFGELMQIVELRFHADC